MTSVHIVDYTLKIKQALSDVDSNVTLYDDEVKVINTVEKMQPDIVLLHYDVRKEATLNCIRFILRVSPDSKVVIIADKLKEEEIFNCLLAGAKGYQEMTQLDVYANKLVSVVSAGEGWITRRMVSILLDKLRAA
jgi:DNA-binding NarL/FixJ family response regulator